MGDNVITQVSLENLCTLALTRFREKGVHIEPVSSHTPEGHLRGKNHVARNSRASQRGISI